MQEDEKDADGTDIFHQKQIKVEETSPQRSPVGELVMNYAVGNKPSDEDTGQEAYYWQEYLSRDEVEPVEQRAAEEG